MSNGKEPYIPPFRRGQQDSPDMSLLMPPSNVSSRVPRGGRGGDAAHDDNNGGTSDVQHNSGGENGGRGRRQSLYYRPDIGRFYWGELWDDANSRPLNSSRDRDPELAYVLLDEADKSNWEKAYFLFTDSNLETIPGYSLNKCRRGEWERPSVPTPSSSSHPDEASSRHSSRNDCNTSYNGIGSRPEEELRRMEDRFAQIRYLWDEPPQIPVADIKPIAYDPAPHALIAIFQQLNLIPKPRFEFVGWFTVKSVAILAPRSAELKDMLEMKRASRNDRPTQNNASALQQWNLEMGKEWAMIQFEKHEGPEVPGPPVIERRRNPAESRNPDLFNLRQRLSDANMNDSLRQQTGSPQPPQDHRPTHSGGRGTSTHLGPARRTGEAAEHTPLQLDTWRTQGELPLPQGHGIFHHYEPPSYEVNQLQQAGLLSNHGQRLNRAQQTSTRAQGQSQSRGRHVPTNQPTRHDED
ncbi:hypothetical protein F4781DRAFT_442127 [Annulohypoxylon bovei var. microspora]|nr:hypothetical protein F4781DRAFT_442127 [Annulohypoxylon bovei var. microspora]